MVNDVVDKITNVNMFVRKWVSALDSNIGGWQYVQYHEFNWIQMTETNILGTPVFSPPVYTVAKPQEITTVTFPLEATADLKIDNSEENYRRDRVLF